MGLTIHVMGFALMFSHKKIAKFLCFHCQKRITAIDSAQQSIKTVTFSTFVGHFHLEKSDFKKDVVLRTENRKTR